MKKREEEDYFEDMEGDVEQEEARKLPNKKAISFGTISNTHLIILAIIGYALYLVFSNDSAVSSCYNTQMSINKIDAQIGEIDRGIRQDCVIINGLNSDKEFLIKYVREHLYLSNKDEDIYIIESENILK